MDDDFPELEFLKKLILQYKPQIAFDSNIEILQEQIKQYFLDLSSNPGFQKDFADYLNSLQKHQRGALKMSESTSELSTKRQIFSSRFLEWGRNMYGMSLEEKMVAETVASLQNRDMINEEGFNRPNFFEKGEVEIGGEKYVLACHRFGDRMLFYDSGGNVVEELFGGPYNLIYDFVEEEGLPMIIAQKDSGSLWGVYTEDGRADWFGGLHSQNAGFMDTSFGKLLVVKNPKDGLWYLYSKDGRTGWFGGPHLLAPHFFFNPHLNRFRDIELFRAKDPRTKLHHFYSKEGKDDWFGGPFNVVKGIEIIDDNPILTARKESGSPNEFFDLEGRVQRMYGAPHDWIQLDYVEVEGTKYLLAGKSREGYHRLFSKEGLSFKDKEAVKSYSYGAGQENDKDFQDIVEWLAREDNPVTAVPVEVVDGLQSGLLYEAGKRNLLEALDIISPVILRTNENLIVNQELEPFSLLLKTTKAYEKEEYYQFDLEQAVDAVLNLRDEEARKRFDVGVNFNLNRLPGRIRNSIGQISEYSNWGLEGYSIVARIGRGGWSMVFALVEEDSEKEDITEILKIPFQQIHGEPADKIIKHFGGREIALENMIKEEQRIAKELSRRSLLKFSPNFNYLPMPFYKTIKKVDLPEWTVIGLIYEFVDGETIKEHFEYYETPKDITTYTFLHAMSRAAYALNFVHLNLGPHNDVKSTNFMISENGEFGFILDTAFARMQNHEMSLEGSLACLAPERIEGAPASRKADIYSFGVMMYEVLAGRRPFEYADFGGDRNAMEEYITRNKHRIRIEQDVPKINPNVAEIVNTCLEPDPGKRINSMQDVENALVSLYKNET